MYERYHLLERHVGARLPLLLLLLIYQGYRDYCLLEGHVGAVVALQLIVELTDGLAHLYIT